MAGIAPSVGDIVMLCRFTWETCAKFKKAPEGFSQLYEECNAFYEFLSQVDRQAKNPWSPFNLVFQGNEYMGNYVPKCEATLRKLQEKLAKCDRMEFMDRIKFIATNFEEPRQELRNHRDNISAQLQIGANDALGRLLEIVSEMAAAIREGRRSTIIDTRDRTANDVEETRTLVEEELQRSARDISGNEVERYRPVVERYVEMLSERGGFKEIPPQQSAYSEIGPDDSVSVLDTLSEGPKFYPPRYMEVSCSGWPKYRGMPIEKISYETIFNPNVDSRSFPKPETCDIWGLVSACWQLQTLCAEKLRLDTEYQHGDKMSILQDISDALANFAPTLLCCLAKSSTNSNFWAQLSQRDRAVSSGKDLMKSLRTMTKLVGKFTHLPKETPEPLLATTTAKTAGIKKIFRSKSATSLKKTISLTTPDYREINGCHYELKQSRANFSKYLQASLNMGKAEFRDEINAVNKNWRRRYEVARRQATGVAYLLEGNAEDGQLLMQWLHAAQGLDFQQSPSQGLDRLLNQLAFRFDPRDRLVLEEAQLDYKQGTVGPSSNSIQIPYTDYQAPEIATHHPTTGQWQQMPSTVLEPLQNPFRRPVLQPLQQINLQSPPPFFPTTSTNFSTGNFLQRPPPPTLHNLTSLIAPSPSLPGPAAVAAEADKILAQQELYQDQGSIVVTLTTPGGDTLQPEDEPARVAEPEAIRDESQLWQDEDVARLQGEAGAGDMPQPETARSETTLLDLEQKEILGTKTENHQPMQTEVEHGNADVAHMNGHDEAEEEIYFDADEEAGPEDTQEI